MNRDQDKEKFWIRVGHWFKPTGTNQPDVDPNIESDMTSSLGMERESTGTVATKSSSDIVDAVSRSRLGRSSSAMERLEQEYNRVVGLVESIQDHLGQNSERSELMVRSLDRLAESLDHLPETSRKQIEVLESLRQEVATDAQCAVNIEQAVSQLPQIADAQREAMVTISRRLEDSRETDEKLTTTLESVEQSVTQMGEAANASAKTISMIRLEDASQQDRIAKLLQQQTERITLMATVAIVLAVTAVILGLVSLFRS